MKSIATFFSLLILSTFSYAQYHTLTMPQASPYVKETQRLGVTNITVEYHAPQVRKRKVWGGIVPMNGKPVAWRAGANINTRISFSTDVTIEGKKLPKGSYGFHAIPGKDEWKLIFAHNDNLWGSYYLDMSKDVAITVTVKPEAIEHREWLSYEFRDRTKNSLTVAVEWEKLRIPFKVGIDLNKTTVASLRYQLRGHNTNSWAAWNAAADWCLRNKTNLEEALQWADRSIKGGFGGFRANKNFDNLSTKAGILVALGRKAEAKKVIKASIPLGQDPGNMYYAGRRLITQGFKAEAVELYEAATKKFAKKWFVFMGLAYAQDANGKQKAAMKNLKKAKELAPKSRKGYLDQLMTKLKNKQPLLGK